MTDLNVCMYFAELCYELVSLTSVNSLRKSCSLSSSPASLLPDVLQGGGGAVVPEVAVVFTDFPTVRSATVRVLPGVELHPPAVHHGAVEGLHAVPLGDGAAGRAEVLPAGSPLGPGHGGRAGEKCGEEESGEPEHDIWYW